MDEKYRHELKYPLSAGQIALARARLSGLISPDPHAGPNGIYNIRSLYFDDYYDRCYYENENGTDPREKFRIRIYNHSSARIALELKRKERGKTLKTSCRLTEEQTRQLMAGIPPEDIGSQPPLLRRLCAEMLEHGMHPAVIVEYDRIPYIYPHDNVRITFDTNVSSCRNTALFLEDRIPKRPVMPVGLHLLEVKYDAYLPDFLYRALQLDSLQQSAYSKYYLCRKYEL